ncbi:MAG: peptidylprolyl isomerase [Alphaproteobacteria bacterium]|nr:peptidylprolyl isomerase [Alphaproteobacteria bacterium]
MSTAKTGDTVKVHYTGTLADGTEFDTSVGREPLEFTIGEGAIISGFEEAIVGMTLGENKSIEIGSAEAYGPRHEELVQVVEREALPAHLEPEVGMRLQATGPDNRELVLVITDVSDSSVTLDANHPLAGHDLTFSIELVEIG